MNRRRYLSVAGLALLAGCSSDGNNGSPADDSTTTATSTPSPSPTSTQTSTQTPTKTPTPTQTPTPRPTPTATPIAGERVQDVDLGSADASPQESFTSLQVEYNWRAQFGIDFSSGDEKGYFPSSNRKWLIAKLRVTNTGDTDISMTPSLFVVSVSGAQYSYTPLEGNPSQLSGVTLTPGGTLTGWAPYEIPMDVSVATLGVDQETYVGNVAVEFEQNNGLSVDVAAYLG